jgi:hypothetical protein
MKNLPAIQLALAVASLAPLPVLAQSPTVENPPSLNLDAPRSPSPHRFGLGYRVGLNVPLSFKGLGSFPALSASSLSTPDGDPYNYDNGYVYPDSSQSTESTWYYGYVNADQRLGDTTFLVQRSVSVATADFAEHHDKPMSGFELTYNRELIRKKTWRGGLEGAFGFTHMSVHDGATQSATVARLYDTYSIASADPTDVLPLAPYRGDRNGPGALISTSPSSSTPFLVEEGAVVTGQREFSAGIFGIRLGPYVEIPLSKSIAFNLSGGFAAVYVNSEFRYKETATVFGAGSTAHLGSGWNNGWLAGAYVAGNFSVALSDSWAVAAGAQFVDAGRYSHGVNGKEATLDFSRSIFVTLGFTYSF